MQYRALQKIQHGILSVAPGELVDLTAEDAAPLLASKAVEAVHKPFEMEIVVPGADK